MLHMNSTQLDFILLYAVIAMSDFNLRAVYQIYFSLVHLLAFVQLYGVHGPLSKRAPGKAFLAENIQVSA